MVGLIPVQFSDLQVAILCLLKFISILATEIAFWRILRDSFRLYLRKIPLNRPNFNFWRPLTLLCLSGTYLFYVRIRNLEQHPAKCFTDLLLLRRCFPVNFAKFLRTSFLQNTFGRLLLSLYIRNFHEFRKTNERCEIKNGM